MTWQLMNLAAGARINKYKAPCRETFLVSKLPSVINTVQENTRCIPLTEIQSNYLMMYFISCGELTVLLIWLIQERCNGNSGDMRSIPSEFCTCDTNAGQQILHL